MDAMGLIRPPELIAKIKNESYIKKGNVPINKGKKQTEYMSPEAIEKTKATRFKKGNKPKNTLPGNFIVTIRTNYKRKTRTKYIKISDRKYQELHRYVYEKKFGKIPKGMCVAFKDGDPMNCDISNLELITRQENMLRNTIHRYPFELKQSIIKLSKLNNKIKSYATK